MDSKRWVLVPDPERVRFEKYLDTLPAWEIPDFTVEQLEILNRPPRMMEAPKHKQLCFPGF